MIAVRNRRVIGGFLDGFIDWEASIDGLAPAASGRGEARRRCVLRDTMPENEFR